MYVIADMMEAKILYEQVSLKQSAIIIAHHIAEHKPAPQEVIDFDTHFTSKLFEIQSSKAMIKAAEKEHNDVQAEIQTIQKEAENKIKQIENLAEDKLKDQVAKRQILAEAKIDQLTRDANNLIQSLNKSR